MRLVPVCEHIFFFLIALKIPVIETLLSDSSFSAMLRSRYLGYRRKSGSPLSVRRATSQAPRRLVDRLPSNLALPGSHRTCSLSLTMYLIAGAPSRRPQTQLPRPRHGGFGAPVATRALTGDRAPAHRFVTKTSTAGSTWDEPATAKAPTIRPPTSRSPWQDFVTGYHMYETQHDATR